MIQLTDQPIDVAQAISFVQAAQAGAVNVFIGTVRDNTAARKVVRLAFEAYDTMAIREMEKIAAAAKEKWAVGKIAIQHRTGVLAVGEVAVVIAVSAPHRQEAFAACRYIIDTLKQAVPIWKKEIFEDGEVWVAAHP